MPNVTPEDLNSLIEDFESSDWAELQVSMDGFELHLAKDAAARGRLHRTHVQTSDGRHDPGVRLVDTGTVVPASKDSADRTAVPEGLIAVRAPNLGTFYQAPKPGAKPYVEIGQSVDADTELCVIEVMKLYTSVVAGVAGVVRQRLVKDAEMVEFDQPLFLIEPIGASAN